MRAKLLKSTVEGQQRSEKTRIHRLLRRLQKSSRLFDELVTPSSPRNNDLRTRHGPQTTKGVSVLLPLHEVGVSDQ